MWSGTVTENVEVWKALQRRQDLNKPVEIATFFWYITRGRKNSNHLGFKRREKKRIPGLFVLFIGLQIGLACAYFPDNKQ